MIKNTRYALPYAAPHVAYAHAPLVYNALDTGLVYPVAEPYVHDATGEVLLVKLARCCCLVFTTFCKI